MKRITVEKYSDIRRADWDGFVESSKNAPFFFQRGFIEYHADRYEDFSLILSNGDAVVGLIPCSIDQAGKRVTSHGGLTFGGVVTNEKMTTGLFLLCFEAFLERLREEGVRKLIYKAIPHFYHQLPAAEEYYAATKLGGNLYRRDVGSILDPQSRCPVQSRRQRMIKKARDANVRTGPSDDFEAFWTLLTATLLDRHDTVPVHTLDEIKYLVDLFPDNIKLFAAHHESAMVAGAIIFDSKIVAHSQYIASNDLGRDIGGLDLLFDRLITETYRTKNIFSFGISTEANGTELNEGLISFKEGFGARAAISDFYEFDL